MLQKQNFIKCICLVFTLSIFYLNGNSQALIKLLLNKDNIYERGYLVSEKQVKGYYQMYEVEKISKGISKFKLEILDPSLNIIASEEFNHSNTANKFHLFYNGDHIITKNYHTREKIGIINKYDLGLKLIESAKVSEKSFVFTTQYYFSPMPNNGLLEITPGEVGKIMFNSLNIKYHLNDEIMWKNKVEMPFPILSGVFEMESDFIFKTGLQTMSKVDHFIYGMDTQTGETFKNKIQFKSDKNLVAPIFKKYSENELIAYGIYRRWKKDSGGIYLSIISKEGDVKNISYVSYDDDIYSKYPEIKRTKNTFVKLSNIVKTNRDEYFIIGQVYDRDVKQIGIQYIYRDIFITKLDADLEIESTNTYQNSIPARKYITSSDPINSALISKKSKIGGFNLIFTQSNEDNSEFTIVCLDPVMKNKKEAVTEIVYRSYIDGEWIVGRIKPKYDNIINVLPAKFGYILIEEYNETENTYESRLEKLNF